LLRAEGLKPQVVLDLNMISSNASEQAAMVSHALSIGLDVLYVELGERIIFSCGLDDGTISKRVIVCEDCH